jgi:microcystin-dependent protein
VQPVITGGSYTLANALTTTGNVSLLSASGASYTANIGGATGNLIVQSANTNVTGNLSVGGSLTVATGGGIIPVGGIIMWSGSIAAIPSGWQLCNGTNGTPDLRNQFVVGAGSTYAVAGTGGSADAVVVSHTHSITDPGHTHTLTNLARYTDTVNGGPATIQTLTNSPNTTVSAVTGISIATAGVSGTNANLPPYYALAYIMKI